VNAVADQLGLTLRKPFLRSYELVATEAIALAKPLTYMNGCGTVVPALMRRAGVDSTDLLVVCDNMDLAPGEVRLKRRGNSRSHNGIASIMDALSSGDFPRLYVGIGRPPTSEETIEYVLSTPTSSEQADYDKGVEHASRAVLRLVSDSIDEVMNDLNRRT
jgi:PTH1 family peptidyl-tRNA hydrolase